MLLQLMVVGNLGVVSFLRSFPKSSDWESSTGTARRRATLGCDLFEVCLHIYIYICRSFVSRALSLPLSLASHGNTTPKAQKITKNMDLANPKLHDANFSGKGLQITLLKLRTWHDGGSRTKYDETTPVYLSQSCPSNCPLSPTLSCPVFI